MSLEIYTLILLAWFDVKQRTNSLADTLHSLVQKCPEIDGLCLATTELGRAVVVLDENVLGIIPSKYSEHMSAMLRDLHKMPVGNLD